MFHRRTLVVSENTVASKGVFSVGNKGTAKLLYCKGLEGFLMTNFPQQQGYGAVGVDRVFGVWRNVLAALERGT